MPATSPRRVHPPKTLCTRQYERIHTLLCRIRVNSTNAARPRTTRARERFRRGNGVHTRLWYERHSRQTNPDVAAFFGLEPITYSVHTTNEDFIQALLSVADISTEHGMRRVMRRTHERLEALKQQFTVDVLSRRPMMRCFQLRYLISPGILNEHVYAATQKTALTPSVFTDVLARFIESLDERYVDHECSAY